ncbi:MAG TPA: RNA-binding cell elongation regulator Jag/EloR, partial [Clostridiales bacterium]|nr:RNA-binding cell elongation regulator Jag/EloR [Clostridiales bacterium]
SVMYRISGKDSGIVIGRRGETLDALQYLTSLVVNKHSNRYVRVTMDVENYREKREETLVRLARRLADKVVRFRRSISLEPMNPYERRIIHSALQNNEFVETYSVGEDPNRKVVIALKQARSGR